jgi:chromosome segregation ATPase
LLEIQKRFDDFLPTVKKERNRYKKLKREGAGDDELKTQLSVYHDVKKKLKEISAEKKPFKDDKNRWQTGVERLEKLMADDKKELEKNKGEVQKLSNEIKNLDTKVSQAKKDQEEQTKK